MKVKKHRDPLPKWAFYKARERLAQSIEQRKKMLEAAYHAQLHAERVNIEAHIGKLQPGVRKVYLQKRLEELKRIQT